MREENKDPAMLFYPSDFLVDTMLFDDIVIGRYIKLMCFLHQKGHLLYEDILSIVKEENSPIFKLLEIDEKGLYYIAKIDQEIARRKAYSESRKNNRKKTCETCVEDMGTETVTETINNYITNNNYSSELKETIKTWLDYKLERKEIYKQQGFKSLLTQIKNKVNKFGEDKVIEVITTSMASNYKGITFDKLKKEKNYFKPYKTNFERSQEALEKARREFADEQKASN